MTHWRTLALISLAAAPGWGVPFDLAPPLATGLLDRFLSDVTGDDRGVLLQALSNLQMGGAGARFDPLAGGLTALRLSVHSVTGSAGAFALGGVLASADAAAVDAGMAFYDVPLSFLLSAGSYYYLAFSNPTGAGWGNNQNEMELFEFDAASSAAFTVGPVRVLDGGAFPVAGMRGFANTVMPHVQLLEAGAVSGGGGSLGLSAVPEPATAALMLGVLLAGLAGGRVRRS